MEAKDFACHSVVILSAIKWIAGNYRRGDDGKMQPGRIIFLFWGKFHGVLALGVYNFLGRDPTIQRVTGTDQAWLISHGTIVTCHDSIYGICIIFRLHLRSQRSSICISKKCCHFKILVVRLVRIFHLWYGPCHSSDLLSAKCLRWK